MCPDRSARRRRRQAGPRRLTSSRCDRTRPPVAVAVLAVANALTAAGSRGTGVMQILRRQIAADANRRSAAAKSSEARRIACHINLGSAASRDPRALAGRTRRSLRESGPPTPASPRCPPRSASRTTTLMPAAANETRARAPRQSPADDDDVRSLVVLDGVGKLDGGCAGRNRASRRHRAVAFGRYSTLLCHIAARWGQPDLGTARELRLIRGDST